MRLPRLRIRLETIAIAAGDFAVLRALFAALVVMVSRPFLIGGLVGRWLARRAVARLPRWRFAMLTGLVSFGFAGSGCAVGVRPRPFRGSQDIALKFQVIDRDSGRPVPSAQVQITDAFDKTATPPRAFTGDDGRASVTAPFQVEGSRNAFRGTKDFSPWGRWVEVSAPGYQDVCLPTTEALQGRTNLVDPHFREIALARGITPEPTNREIAATYFSGAHGSSWGADS